MEVYISPKRKRIPYGMMNYFGMLTIAVHMKERPNLSSLTGWFANKYILIC